MKKRVFVFALILFLAIAGIVAYMHKTVLKRSCTSKNMGLTFILPSQDWICTVNQSMEEHATNEGEGWINLKSSFFNLDIMNPGQGPYCGGGGFDPTCKQLDFYSAKKIDLSITNYKGIDKNIYGEYKVGKDFVLNNNNQGKPWVTISYTNIEKQKLTDSQKKELFNLLESAY